MGNRETAMKTWQVEYSATYWVKAETYEEAVELGAEEHFKMPMGDWDAMVDPWDSDNFNTENDGSSTNS